MLKRLLNLFTKNNVFPWKIPPRPIHLPAETLAELLYAYMNHPNREFLCHVVEADARFEGREHTLRRAITDAIRGITLNGHIPYKYRYFPLSIRRYYRIKWLLMSIEKAVIDQPTNLTGEIW